MVRRARLLGALSVAVVVSLSGCQYAQSVTPTEEQLIGVWESAPDSEVGRVSLVFEDDGTFVIDALPAGVFCSHHRRQTVELSRSKFERIEGIWLVQDAPSFPLLMDNGYCAPLIDVLKDGPQLVLRIPNGPVDDFYEHIDFVREDPAETVGR